MTITLVSRKVLVPGSKQVKLYQQNVWHQLCLHYSHALTKSMGAMQVCYRVLKLRCAACIFV